MVGYEQKILNLKYCAASRGSLLNEYFRQFSKHYLISSFNSNETKRAWFPTGLDLQLFIIKQQALFTFYILSKYSYMINTNVFVTDKNKIF